MSDAITPDEREALNKILDAANFGLRPIPQRVADAIWIAAKNYAAPVPAREWIPVGELIAKQAEDDGLWFVAETAAEAYLQRALRDLHAACETRPQDFVNAGWAILNNRRHLERCEHGVRWEHPCRMCDNPNRGPSRDAEPEKPVAWMYEYNGYKELSFHRCPRGARTETPLYASPSAQPIAREPLKDGTIINAAYEADGDPSDVTRVSEMTPEGWKATTIFDGDAGLLRFARLIEAAALKSAGKEST